MIYHGDLFDVLATIEAESVDSCVTDPPYDLTANKRGGTGEASLNLTTPAGRSRISTGGGFMGKKWDATGVAFNPETWRLVMRVLKPGAYLLAFGGTRTFHRMGVAIEAAGFEVRDSLAWLYGSGFPKSLNIGDGLGTALKPAFEPVIMARKPFKGSVRANVEKHGTGALNIDACRINMTSDEDTRRNAAGGENGLTGTSTFRIRERRVLDQPLRYGRWPANVALDEIAAMVLDEQSGELASGFMAAGTEREGIGYHGGLGCTVRNNTHGDVGGASRFFYVAKPSREERDMGCYDLPAKTAAEITNRKPGSSGLNNPRAGVRAGSSETDPNRTAIARNVHPTVKPVELMRWLVRLVTPVGGTVLDPFLGSGTTGMACKYEQREFIGIEREAEYVAIAERRIASVAPLFDAVDPVGRGSEDRPRADLFSDVDPSV